jgi:dihydrofolate reductase
MNGGTTLDFLDASPAQALAQARQAAAGGDVPIGGPSAIREFLAAGLIDYLHIVVVPIVLGRGERLWDGLEGLEDRFQIEAVNSPSGVTHVTLSRR